MRAVLTITTVLEVPTLAHVDDDSAQEDLWAELEHVQRLNVIEMESSVKEEESRERLREALRELSEREGWGDDAADEWWRERIRAVLREKAE